MKKSKLFCMILAVIVVWCSLPYEVYAQENEEAEKMDVNEVEWCSGIGGDVPLEFNINGNSVQYEYDSALMRSRKTVNGQVVADYVYDGSHLVQEMKGDVTVSYSYAIREGRIEACGFSYSGKDYTYGYEGNIIRYIFDEEENCVAEYEYDGYGRVCNVVNYDTVNRPGDINSLVYYGVDY